MGTAATVMVLCLLFFYASAFTLVPMALGLLGVDPGSATGGRALALRHLLLDLSQLGFTLGLLARALRDQAPRRLGFFRVALRPVLSWLPVVLAGCALFPAIQVVHKVMVWALPPALPQPVATAASGGADWVARSMWFAILGVCGPMWEEILFRGFLLPPLAARLPPPAAVAATSLLFALVHFTREGFVPLLLLGCLFGAAYVRTQNLVPPILLHGLWNIWLMTSIQNFS
jgi:membrane protease YdiL (CAAX protease family)